VWGKEWFEEWGGVGVVWRLVVGGVEVGGVWWLVVVVVAARMAMSLPSATATSATVVENVK
jgi:hypothetical protein